MKTQLVLKKSSGLIWLASFIVLTAASGGAQERPFSSTYGRRVGNKDFLEALGDSNKVQIQSGGELKSETTALYYSLGGTLLPISIGALALAGGLPAGFAVGTAAGGMIIGPSLGYFYGEEDSRGTKGILLRSGVGILALTVAGIQSESGGRDFSALEHAVAIGAVGTDVIIVCDIYDIATVQGTIRKHNQTVKEMSLSLAPEYFDDSGAIGMKARIVF